uniref:Uncharacterized protein n=1 Tax=Peronospora matthiolae TaxID=2874970 RepID=A0AAV1U526_9STRA
MFTRRSIAMKTVSERQLGDCQHMKLMLDGKHAHCQGVYLGVLGGTSVRSSDLVSKCILTFGSSTNSTHEIMKVIRFENNVGNPCRTCARPSRSTIRV